MKKTRGNTRTAYIFESFVIKIAVIDWGQILPGLRAEWQQWRLRTKKGYRLYYAKRALIRQSVAEAIFQESQELGLEILPAAAYELAGWRYALGRGIMANWHEYVFYQKTKNPFVMPTYFSLFGLLNIQKKAEPITFWRDGDMFAYLRDNAMNPGQVTCDKHSLGCLENFGLDGDKLKMIDYGSRHVHSFLKVNGERLANNFVKPQA